MASMRYEGMLEGLVKHAMKVANYAANTGRHEDAYDLFHVSEHTARVLDGHLRRRRAMKAS